MDETSDQNNGPTPPPLPLPKLDVLGCFERSFALFRENAGLLIAVSLVSALFHLGGFIHLAVGYALNLTLVGVITAGMMGVFLRRLRNQPARFADLFLGFREQFLQLLLATFVCGSLEMMASYPLSAYIANPQAVQLWLVGLSFLSAVYVGLIYTFTFPLVLDRGLNFWEAMDTSRRLVMTQPFRILGLSLLGGLVVILGLLCLGVGILVALPLVYGAIAYAYEDLVRATE